VAHVRTRALSAAFTAATLAQLVRERVTALSARALLDVGDTGEKNQVKIVTALFAGSLLGTLATGGCGDPNHTGPNDSEDLSHLTPAELCQQKCDLQAAPHCSNVPPDYGSNCALICQAKYDKFPSCTSAARALDACAIQRVSYGCESGTISTTPVGACASESLACASCTGSFTDCL
jgi:hypothetical protein